MKAFLTGSHVYGLPHEASDVDLVIPGDVDLATRILSLVSEANAGGSGPCCIQLGQLNLIILPPDVAEAWKQATDELAIKRPVTRDEAVNAIKLAVSQRDV